MAKFECAPCGDSGTIKTPPKLPPGVNRQTHTWDEMRALSTEVEVFACPHCWRGQMKQLTDKLVPLTFN